MVILKTQYGTRPPYKAASVLKGETVEVVQSLSGYLNYSDYDGLAKNIGMGIRTYNVVQNSYETFERDFDRKVKLKVSSYLLLAVFSSIIIYYVIEKLFFT